MTNELYRVRRRHIWLMKTTIDILEHVTGRLPEKAWRTWRDGEDGWSILEVVGHLRDFDKIFKRRAEMMLVEEKPNLGAFDHEAMAIEKRYNEQPIDDVWLDFLNHRRTFVDFYRDLGEEAWSREGVHPEREVFTMLDSVMQVGLHDINHIGQITRIIDRQS